MSTPYIGQILLVGFNFAPVYYNQCDGTTLSIAENSTLFQLIGTTYGGDGVSTFGLPDLRSRITVHTGPSSTVGMAQGVESVGLTTGQLPTHSHGWQASKNIGNQNNPSGAVLAGSGQTQVYSDQPPAAGLNAGVISFAGGNQAHENRQPFLVCNWIIALYGVYPTQG